MNGTWNQRKRKVLLCTELCRTRAFFFFFFNGLYLSLKNSASIQSVSVIFKTVLMAAQHVCINQQEGSGPKDKIARKLKLRPILQPPYSTSVARPGLGATLERTGGGPSGRTSARHPEIYESVHPPHMLLF